MKVIYCSFEKISDPIFNSQVVLFLKEIQKKFRGPEDLISLVNFGSIPELFKRDYKLKKKAVKDFLNIRTCFFFKLPYSYRYPKLFKTNLLLNAFLCIFVFLIFFKIRKNEQVIFHCRNHLVSYIILKVKKIFYKNIKIICDCRGLGSQEVILKYSFGPRRIIQLSSIMHGIEKTVYLDSDHLFCVSDAFRNYIIKEIEPENRNISVIPCCIDTNQFTYDPVLRQRIREKLNIPENFVLLYSGSMNKWQLFPDIIRIFMIFKRIIDRSILLVYTQDTAEAEHQLKESGLPSELYIIKSFSHSQISSYLLAGDLGLLIREDNPVNEIAFPVKFTEYVSCGVPVLSSIKSDVISLIKKHKLGFDINDYRDEKEIEEIAKKIKVEIPALAEDKYKSKISEIMRKEMGWGSYTDEIMNIYRKL